MCPALHASDSPSPAPHPGISWDCLLRSFPSSCSRSLKKHLFLPAISEHQMTMQGRLPAQWTPSRCWRPPASKKRMRRRKTQSTSKEERPHSSCSRSISFPVPTVPSPAAPEPSFHAKKTFKDLSVPDVVGSSQVLSKNCPAISKPNLQKGGYGSSEEL